jgi:uncharacterized membrane protein (UPF0127 family)
LTRVLFRQARTAISFAAVLCLLAACKNTGAQKQSANAAESTTPTVVVDTGQRRVTFRVEVARTGAEHERGLMFREHLPADTGMIFLFDRASVQTFWMKNTLIPLDMIFIASDHTIAGIVHDAEPLTLMTRAVDDPSQYVLEIGGGLSARLGLGAGQRVEFVGVDGP